MKKHKRLVNKKLVRSLMAYNELNLGTLGKQCDPPVTRASISMLLNQKGGAERLMNQISDILHMPSAILFPYEVDR